jgi:hypothetical protein
MQRNLPLHHSQLQVLLVSLITLESIPEHQHPLRLLLPQLLIGTGNKLLVLQIPQFLEVNCTKPTSNQYSLDRAGKNDALHIAVVDDRGTITGNSGTILEKFVGLSKAFDSISAVNSPQKIWYEQFLADFSSQIYAGSNPSSATDSYHGTAPRAVGFSTAFTPFTTSQGLWGQNAQGITFAAIGNVSYTLTEGVDYSANGGMKASLGDLITSYDLFSNKDEIQVDYLIMGPGLHKIKLIHRQRQII